MSNGAHTTDSDTARAGASFTRLRSRRLFVTDEEWGKNEKRGGLSAAALVFTVQVGEPLGLPEQCQYGLRLRVGD